MINAEDLAYTISRSLGVNMIETRKTINSEWNDERVDVSAEANFIWNIANKLRGTYMLKWSL